jgi:hypothetical protein
MMSIGALRLAIDRWKGDQGKRPMSIYLNEAFADLKSAIEARPNSRRAASPAWPGGAR